MRRWIAISALACMALGAPRLARADDDKAAAKEIFRAAEAAFSRGEYRAAALAFESADERSPNGGAAYNAGIAWSRAGESVRAADALARALASGELSGTPLADAKKRLAALAKKLGVLRLALPPNVTVTVSHFQPGKAPVRVYLEPGEHPVSLQRGNGETETRIVTATAGVESTLELEAPVIESRVEPSPPPAPPPARRQPEAQPANPWPWVVVSAGAVSMGAGVFLLTRGIDARDEFEASGRTNQDAHDRAVGHRTWSTLALFGGAALVATGVTWMVIGSKGPRDARVSVGVQPAGVFVHALGF